MSNYSFSINLSQIPGAEQMHIETDNGVKPFICIPLDAPCVFSGKKGVYADFLAMEAQGNQYGQTHYIKPSVSKQAYDQMTEEQRKAIPICGNMKEIYFGGNQPQQTQQVSAQNPVKPVQAVRTAPYQQTPQAQPVQQQPIDPHDDPGLPF